MDWILPVWDCVLVGRWLSTQGHILVGRWMPAQGCIPVDR